MAIHRILNPLLVHESSRFHFLCTDESYCVLIMNKMYVFMMGMVEGCTNIQYPTGETLSHPYRCIVKVG